MLLDMLQILRRLRSSYQQSFSSLSYENRECINSSGGLPLDLKYKYVQWPFRLFRKICELSLLTETGDLLMEQMNDTYAWLGDHLFVDLFLMKSRVNSTYVMWKATGYLMFVSNYSECFVSDRSHRTAEGGQISRKYTVLWFSRCTSGRKQKELRAIMSCWNSPKSASVVDTYRAFWNTDITSYWGCPPLLTDTRWCAAQRYLNRYLIALTSEVNSFALKWDWNGGNNIELYDTIQ